jgi:hypothetical protein
MNTRSCLTSSVITLPGSWRTGAVFSSAATKLARGINTLGDSATWFQFERRAQAHAVDAQQAAEKVLAACFPLCSLPRKR